MFSNTSLGIIGSKFHLGQKKLGVELGPQTIRNHGLQNLVSKNFPHRFDYGDLYQDFTSSQMWEEGKFISYMEKLKQNITRVIEENDFCLHLGGDHSVGLASVAAVKSVYPDAIILWIDAHGDVNTLSQSNSGSIHGMPLAALLGIEDNQDSSGNWDSLCQEFQCLDPQDLIYLGVRDLDKPELENIKNLKIQTYTTKQCRSEFFKAKFSEHWNKINPIGDRPVYISFDLDSLDPTIARATGVDVRNGLFLEDLDIIFEVLQGRCNLIGTDCVELNPLLVNDKETLKESVDSVFHFLDKCFSLVRQKHFPQKDYRILEPAQL